SFHPRQAVKRAILLSLAFILSYGCATRQDSPTTGRQPTGTWVGDFGPAFYDRNTISLELKWDGNNLTGQIVPGDPNGRMYRKFSVFPRENPSSAPRPAPEKCKPTHPPGARR